VVVAAAARETVKKKAKDLIKAIEEILSPY